MAALSRRELIRRAAVVGGAAWTAPLIIESLASPAGALSGLTGCFSVTFNPNPNGCLVLGGNVTGCAVTGGPCSTPTVVTTGHPLLACITENAGCDKDSTSVVYTINGCPNCLVVAAAARYRDTSAGGGVDVCIGPSTALPSPSVTFTRPPDLKNWIGLQLIIQCA